MATTEQWGRLAFKVLTAQDRRIVGEWQAIKAFMDAKSLAPNLHGWLRKYKERTSGSN